MIYGPDRTFTHSNPAPTINNYQDPMPAEPWARRPPTSSKRAAQNRQAQRAFRERRDQHVRILEARSQLLDTALASTDEANRRYDECRKLLNQLQIENADLRKALANQLLPLSTMHKQS
ncbi:hypothetical protein B0H17DRAFT_37093 [Mycena rosella]|uniref:BZIP domain-containing protein n=1 Tax=Mycena rosella TaxID=1033263 RepID=A0AAD7D7M8_MYCRO|nr:hypothetical protein B0H17DRAFT_37093 [Mycena rosella]